MWMNGVMYKIFDMSIMASVAILLVLLVRVLFRKLPKVYSYVLWGIVLFRLLCPISVSSPFSIFQVFLLAEEAISYHEMPIAGHYNISNEVTDYLEIGNEEIVATEISNAELSNEQINNMQFVSEDIIGDESDSSGKIKKTATLLWCLGVAFTLTYSVISLLCLKKKLVGAIKLSNNIYLCDYIGIPFVIGIFKPNIYLPSSIGGEEKEYIILHEQIHIKRGDHIFRLFAFIALALHWFNPLVWLAYKMSGVDMEMSCDEAVIKKLGANIRAAYSTSLLGFSTGRRHINGMLLAFGEINVKDRIINIMKFKKPAIITSIVTVMVVVVLIVVMGSNPKAGKNEEVSTLPEDDAIILEESTDTSYVYVEAETEFEMNQDIVSERQEAMVEEFDNVEEKSDEIKEQQAQLDEDSRRKQIEVWAKAFCGRQGRTIVSMVTEDVLNTMEEYEIYYGDYGFGWSSPWPYDDVKDYQILEVTDSSATILYYAWVLSDPHVWVWRETLQFHEEDGRIVIDAEELKEMDNICVGEEFFKAYPNGIKGTPMDFLNETMNTDDSNKTTGEILNQNAMLSSSGFYQALLSPDTAAVYLLNLLDNPNKVKTDVRMNPMGESVSVQIIFMETGEEILLNMIQPYGEDGIWLVQDMEATN